MRSRISSKPQRRLTKLSKDATKQETTTGTDVGADTEVIRASYDTLTPENRQRLREQFTSTFPEATSPADQTTQAAGWSSRDNLTKYTAMGHKDRFAKTASTLTLTQTPVEAPLLSPAPSFYTARPTQPAMPETLDVEAAITLLQELRKKASPEELVALHRALLPVREIEPSPVDTYEHDYQLASEYRRQFSSRRRSNMPPGLATRGGPEDDPLRRYGDIQRRPVPTYRPVVTAATPLGIAKLTERPHTPVDASNGQAGVYRSGTLRITNGTASPVSSMHFTDAYEIQDVQEMKITQTTITTLDLVRELEVSSSDESNLLEHDSVDDSADLGDVTIIHHDLAPIDLNVLETRVSTAMRHYDEFRASPYGRKVSEESQLTSSHDSDEQTFLTPKASVADFVTPISMPQMPTRLPPRPELPVHADSGYVSESSNGKQILRETSRTPVKLRAVEDQRFLTALPDPRDADKHSLYTFEQIINSPSILQARSANESLPSSKSKAEPSRRQTLFSRLRTPSGKTVQAPTDLPESIDTTEAESEHKKKKSKSKKLKKSTPHHIKQARKELKRFEDAALADVGPEPAPVLIPSQPAQKPVNPKGHNDFKSRAPHAYARIRAAENAFEQQQEAHRSRALPGGDRKAHTAMDDDADDGSVINFGAVARSLGASPYDISTRQFSDTIDYIEGSEDKHRIQSPFEIGHGMGMRNQGMDEKAASDLARSKSRDYEGEATNAHTTQPRRARKPFLDRELPPVPVMPTPRTKLVQESETQVEPVISDHEPKTLLPEQEVQSYRTFPMNDGPVSKVDWEPQARMWRERREALNTKLATESPLATRLTGVTPPRKPIRVETAGVETTRIEIINTDMATSEASKVSQAQAVLADARAAIAKRISPPISPLGDSARHSWSQPFSPVSDISTPTTSLAGTIRQLRPPRPPSQVALAEASSSRFSAEYLAQLNGDKTVEALSRLEARPKSAHLSVASVGQIPANTGRPLSADRPLSTALPTADRYSGGFQYEWQREVGVMGSAGTRTKVAVGGERSMPSKLAYGLDLSDVPLIVQKVQA